MTPDWSAKAEPVPYAKLNSPQSLNLYAYVLNNPVSLVDPDGHDDDVPFYWKINAINLGLSPFAAQNQQPMSLSSKGLGFIKQNEGYNGKVYKDVAGNATIGYGHLIQEGENFDGGITEQKASELLKQDTKTAVDAVNATVEASVSQNKFDALVDFTYNLGARNLARSTLASNINAGNNVTIQNFTDWNRAGGKVVPGLTIRRTDEYNLFSNGDYGGQ